MAKVRKNKKLNTSLDDEIPMVDIIVDPIKEDIVVEEVPEGEGEDLMSYTMGKIEAEDSEDDEKEEFDKAAKTVTTPDADDEDAEWVEDEEFNAKDEDFFLDEEDYDPDDPEDIY